MKKLLKSFQELEGKTITEVVGDGKCAYDNVAIHTNTDEVLVFYHHIEWVGHCSSCSEAESSLKIYSEGELTDSEKYELNLMNEDEKTDYSIMKKLEEEDYLKKQQLEAEKKRLEEEKIRMEKERKEREEYERLKNKFGGK